ncbi:hypothetical protein KY284_016379 [Solanum tuberosum]|nr:hypothetical protein KY284_016379 [Solanum tuberosum]
MDENQAPEANNPAPVQTVVDLNSFINGKVDKPSPNSALLTQWERCEDMVTSWILNSLSKDIGDSLQYVNNARELWVELEDRYDQPNGAKLYQLQCEINDLSQGNLDVTGYYTQIKRLWEELSTLDTSSQCTCLCICGGKRGTEKSSPTTNSTWNQHPFVSMLLALTPISGQTMSHHIRMVEAADLQIDPTYFVTIAGSLDTRDKCYKLHRFPPNFKFTKGKNAGTSAIAHGYPEDTMNKGKGPVESAEGSVYKRQGQLLIRQQFDQLVHLLQHVQIQEESNTTTGTVNDNTGGAVNFADSGATHHMTFNKSLLTNIRHLPYPFLITLPNGYKVKVTEIGDVCLNPSLTLWKGPSLKSPLEIGRARNGLYFLCSKCHTYCPDHTSTTLRNATSMPSSSSSSSLTSLSVHPVSSCKSSYNLLNFSSDVSTSHAHTNTPVRSICCSNDKIVSPVPTAASYASTANNPFITCISHGNSVDHLWHNRLGHVPFIKMKRISSIPITFSSKQPFMCTICPMARHTRLPFPTKTIVSSSKPFDLLHMDLWGPYHVSTHDNYK